MSKKTLSTEGITNELAGASVFFTPPEAAKARPARQEVVKQKTSSPPAETPATPKKPAKAPKRESELSGYHAIKQAGYPDSIIEGIRKAVKLAGKEPFFGRFTPEEKRMLADLAYSYKRAGVKTSENEIVRIALNFLVNDHQENGANSLLERILKALHE